MGTGKRRTEIVFRCCSGYSIGKLWRETFWAVGRPYGFYAVHPEKMKENNIATEVSCNDKGELRVTGFDSSEMGKGAVDLMTAAKTDVVYEGAE